MSIPRVAPYLLPFLLCLITLSDVSALSDISVKDSNSITISARRLNETEYRHTIADIFGADIKVQARFETQKREEGLMAIGNTVLSLTSSGFEQYFNLASNISSQVLSVENRAELLDCFSKEKVKADKHCARKFIAHYGELLFRRPLTEQEIDARFSTVEVGAQQTGDFYNGLSLALTSLLVAPEFLFRIEKAEPDPNNSDEYRLDAFTKASRLSYMFWSSTPDQELMDVARSGAIHKNEVLNQQLNRLVNSPRFAEGGRAFFADMLQLEGFDNMVKDPEIYPKFNQTIADSAREQMLKTAVGLLIEQKRDYRDLFRSNDTYINRPLASVYKVAYPSKEEWIPYTFPDDLERAGILTQVGFLSLFAHPGTSSPTRRGIKLHEIFMCEPTPDPPADVDFSKVKDSMKGTVRGRLLDHMENTGCTACHKRSDPPGLALEHFDGIGQLRKYENGILIDVSAEFNGVNLTGAEGLADYLFEDPRISSCLVRNVYAYGTGRVPDFWDEDYLADQTEAFTTNGHKFGELMKQIASTPEFFKAHVPEDITALIREERQQESATAQLTQQRKNN
ncbi:MAG: DUF1592 domain-containing protein [Cellvibrionaceae bacterium]